MEKIQHKGAESRAISDFSQKGVVLTGVLRRGVLDKVADKAEHVGVPADIAERIIAVGMARLDEVKHLDNIPLLQEKRGNCADKLALWVGADKAGICQKKIRLHNKSRLACAAAAHNDLKEIPHMLPSVEAHTQVLCDDDVFVGIFITVLFVQLPDISPQRAEPCSSPGRLFSLEE